MPAAEVRVLGPIEVVGEDGVIVLAGKQARLLAALLVAKGRACGVDELVDAVWEGAAPTSAHKLVQIYVSQVRKVLPAGIEIATRQGAYAASLAPDALDAARFETLLRESVAAREAHNPALALSLADRALSLWRGRAFGELSYDDFARGESERLEELRLEAIEERFAAQLALGRREDVLAEVLAYAEANGLRERAHELAMLALYRGGRQADALEHYSRFRARLDEELGLEPAPALHELQRRILQHDPDLDVAETQAGGIALPIPPNPLVGRERELEVLQALLDRRESRLIVLTGAGGSGKTRLALEVARRVAASYANGVVLVELAPLRDPALVMPTIAQALELGTHADEDALDAVAAALRSQELLLVLDNAEHVRATAPAYAELVARAARLTVLATSRAVLHVSVEHVCPVAPLEEEAAIELFAQRAQRLDPGFEVGAETASDVREICRRLDGLPLAIELAAARIRTLSPRALRERLDSRLSVLTGGPRDSPARQQTLRETIAWSIDLLDEHARQAFARLAIFPGGATVEAAERVCGADLDTLATLVDDHLLVRSDAGGEPRFGMLETVREYALLLLGAERPQAELALAEHFAELADELRLAAPIEPRRRQLIERLDPEIDNVRVALAAALDSGDDELAVRLGAGLSRYWSLRGPTGEGLEWIERALAACRGPPTPARSHALHGSATLALLRKDFERARRLTEAAIPAAVEAGSLWDEQAAHSVLGNVALDQGDHDRARHHHHRSLELVQRLGLEGLTQKHNLAVVVLDSEDYEQAVVLFEDVLDSQRRDKNPGGIGIALLNLGVARYQLGDSQESRRDFEEARACFELDGARERTAHAIQGLAAVAAQESRFGEAARLLGLARRMLDEFGAPEDRWVPDILAATKERARTALGDEAFEEAYAAGREGD